MIHRQRLQQVENTLYCRLVWLMKMYERIKRIRRRSTPCTESEVQRMSREMLATTNRLGPAAQSVHVPVMERIALSQQRASHTGHGTQLTAQRE